MSTPKKFDTETQWVVITGAPSSGKTSVLMELAERGCHVEHEIARNYITDLLKEGKKLEDIRADEGKLQRDILELKLHRETILHPDERIFIDRGVPDSISYYRIADLDSAEAEAKCYHFKYGTVFLFDRLPLVKDGVRAESEEVADLLDKTLEEDYKAVGYQPVRVPVLTIEERADFILQHLAGDG
ncbi:MAG: ATPase [Micavibrio sp.]|nr:MAG: ATPase [Micavibrio sp.]